MHVAITPLQWWFEVRGPQGLEYVQASQPLVDNAPKSFRTTFRYEPEPFYQDQMFRWVKPFCQNQTCDVLNVVEGYGVRLQKSVWLVFSTEENAQQFVEWLHAKTAEPFQ